MATYVGKWDCPVCGTKRIPGWKDGRTVERCPACNAPSTGKWYLDDREMAIGNPEEVAKAKTKRNWKCGHCGHMNDAEDQECDACGNPKDAESDDNQLIAREYDGLKQPKTGEDVEDIATQEMGEGTAETEKGYSKSGRAERAAYEVKAKLMRKRKWIVAGVGLGLVAFVIFLLMWKKEVEVKVVGFAWERKVDIENYGPIQESSWSSPPSGAYSISSQSEIHHYNTVVIDRRCHTETSTEVCGTTDNGNGTFTDRYCTTEHEVCEDITREEPVYQTRYYYTIDRWHFDHTEQAKGDNKNAYWPVFSQTKTSPSVWREGKKGEEYWLKLLREDNTIESQDVPFERWNKTKDRQVLLGYKNVVFGYWMGLKD